jgi:hypothetical protein
MRQVAEVNLVRVLGILDDWWRGTTEGLRVDAVDGDVVFRSTDFEGLVLEADSVERNGGAGFLGRTELENNKLSDDDSEKFDSPKLTSAKA